MSTNCYIILGIINETNMKYNRTKTIKKEKLYLLENLMDAFDTGLPCQSNLLDLTNYSYNILQYNGTKIMVESCKVIYYYRFF